MCVCVCVCVFVPCVSRCEQAGCVLPCGVRLMYGLLSPLCRHTMLILLHQQLPHNLLILTRNTCAHTTSAGSMFSWKRRISSGRVRTSVSEFPYSLIVSWADVEAINRIFFNPVTSWCTNCFYSVRGQTQDKNLPWSPCLKLFCSILFYRKSIFETSQSTITTWSRRSSPHECLPPGGTSSQHVLGLTSEWRTPPGRRYPDQMHKPPYLGSFVANKSQLPRGPSWGT